MYENCSGEYLSHLQKIQFFGRFDCGESLEYFSHLLNISHICKDSDIQKIPLPENTILSLGQNLNIMFPLHSTSHHFTSPPTLSASLQATLCHFTSPTILSASLRAAFHYFCLTSPHFTPLHFSHFVRLASRHFTSPPVLFASLHLTLCHFASPPLSFPASLHATSRRPPFFLTRFTSFHGTSLHLPFCPPSLQFTPLHRLPFFSHSLHLISHHFTLPPVLSASLHATSCHFIPLHFTSHSFCLT